MYSSKKIRHSRRFELSEDFGNKRREKVFKCKAFRHADNVIVCLVA